MTLNFAKHEEEFYGVFKLVNGEEVLGKAMCTISDKNIPESETLIFLQDPVCTHTINKELTDGKLARGIGFSRGMQLSDEYFFIIREKDIIAIASMSKEVTYLYESYINSEDPGKAKERNEVSPDTTVGYLGKIDDARALFEKLFKNKGTFNP